MEPVVQYFTISCQKHYCGGEAKNTHKKGNQALRQGRKSRERWMAKRVDGGAEIKETRRGGGGEGSHNLITANTETQKHLL